MPRQTGHVASSWCFPATTLLAVRALQHTSTPSRRSALDPPHSGWQETAPESRRRGHRLPTVVGVRDRRRLDARACLELPQRLAGRLVEPDELTGQFAAEPQPATGRQPARRAREIGQLDLPFLLAGQRINRYEVTEQIARLDLGEPVVDARGVRADDRLFRRRELLDARHVPRTRVDEAGVRMEGDWHGVRAA